MEPVPSLYRLIRLYRLVLPLAIVLVVVLFEISLEPYQGQPVAFGCAWAFTAWWGPWSPG